GGRAGTALAQADAVHRRSLGLRLSAHGYRADNHEQRSKRSDQGVAALMTDFAHARTPYSGGDCPASPPIRSRNCGSRATSCQLTRTQLWLRCATVIRMT